MDDKTLILAPEELAETQSPPAENWFTDGQLSSDDRQQLHQLLTALLRMYHALPVPTRRTYYDRRGAGLHARRSNVVHRPYRSSDRPGSAAGHKRLS